MSQGKRKKPLKQKRDTDNCYLSDSRSLVSHYLWFVLLWICDFKSFVLMYTQETYCVTLTKRITQSNWQTQAYNLSSESVGVWEWQRIYVWVHERICVWVSVCEYVCVRVILCCVLCCLCVREYVCFVSVCECVSICVCERVCESCGCKKICVSRVCWVSVCLRV